MKKLWKCITCNYTTAPTEKGYQRIRGHANFGHSPDKRGYNLIDAETGEVLAKDINEARGKGLLVGEEEVAEHIPEEKGEVLAEELETEEVEEKVGKPPLGEGKEVTTPEISDGLFRYTVTLPADAFTLFNIAKGYGLEEKDKLFDEFLFDCITQRFAKDYKMQLILAPLLEEA